MPIACVCPVCDRETFKMYFGRYPDEASPRRRGRRPPEIVHAEMAARKTLRAAKRRFRAALTQGEKLEALDRIGEAGRRLQSLKLP